MRIRYIGPFGMQTGYAQAAHDYMLALHRVGADLSIQPIVPPVIEDWDERYNELWSLREKPNEPTHVVVHAPPAYAIAALDIHHKNGRNVPKILITTWETDYLPGDIAAKLNDAFDLVIVPSEFCADALHGILESKVRVVEHTFDPEHWLMAGQPRNELYTFYNITSWTERKNPIGLLKAYLAEFSSSDDVILKLRTPAYNPEDIKALVQCLGYDNLPPVEIVTEHLDHDDLVDFHHAGDCFVACPRGEGWCLPAFEAAVLGKPVIAPSWGGQTEFLEDYPGTHVIGGSLTPVMVPPTVELENVCGIVLRKATQVAPNGITARQKWLEPDLSSLMRAMRTAYVHRWKDNHTGRSDLEKRFGYTAIGSRLLKLIGGMS